MQNLQENTCAGAWSHFSTKLKTSRLETFKSTFLRSTSKWLLLQTSALELPGSETLSSLGPKIWKHFANWIKRECASYIIQKKICEWVPENCSCRLCKTYVQNTSVRYLYVHLLICKMWYVIHIKESVEVVIDDKPYTS